MFPAALNQRSPSSAPCRGAAAIQCRDVQAGSGPHGCISTVLLPILSPHALHARSVGLGRAYCARASTTPGPLQTRAYLKFPEGFDVVAQPSSLKKLNCQGCARPNVGNRWLILHVPLSHGLTTGLPKTSTNRCQSHNPQCHWCSQPPGQPVPLVLGKVLLGGTHPLRGPTCSWCSHGASVSSWDPSAVLEMSKHALKFLLFG